MSALTTKAKAAGWSNEMPTTHRSAPYARAKGGLKRWRVERAGAPSGMGYGLGWVTMCYETGVGAYFATHDAALAFAIEQTTPVLEPTC